MYILKSCKSFLNFEPNFTSSLIQSPVQSLVVTLQFVLEQAIKLTGLEEPLKEGPLTVA